MEAACTAQLFAPEVADLVNATPGPYVSKNAITAQVRLRGITKRPGFSGYPKEPSVVPEHVRHLVEAAKAAPPEFVPRQTWTPERVALIHGYSAAEDTRALVQRINELDGRPINGNILRNKSWNLGLVRPVGFRPIYVKRRRLVTVSDIEAHKRTAKQIDRPAPFARTNFVGAWLAEDGLDDPFGRTLASVLSFLPNTLDAETREEIAQDVALACLESGDAVIDHRTLARTALSRHRADFGNRWKFRSLEDVVPGTDNLRLVDTIASDRFHF